MSVPTSPTTSSPTTQRRRTSLRLASVSSQQPQAMSNSPTFSRRSSRTSQTSYLPESPLTPRPMSSRSSRNSFHGRKTSRAASINSIASNGVADLPHSTSAGLLGNNLADELGEVWDGDDDDDIVEDEGRGESLLDDLREGDIAVQSPSEIGDAQHDFGYTVIHSPLPHVETPSSNVRPPPSPPPQPIGNSLQPPSTKSRGHKKVDSAYDGSDYGPESDCEDHTEGFPPLLRKRMREIEKLSRDGRYADNDTLSEDGGVVKRTIASLRDLGPPQSNVEYGITRIVTAYTSMATHRTHKQREIFSQSHSLLYGNSAAFLPDEFIDLLLDEIHSLVKTIPFLPTATLGSSSSSSVPQSLLLSLHNLASQTNELAQTLRGLADVLQENKLAANAAVRKLKGVREMVEEMRAEDELVENSIMLIQAQDWDRRLRERHAAKMCREVVQGFAEKWDLDYLPREVMGVV